MRGCVRGTARDLLRVKRSRVSVYVLRSNVPAAATNPQIRKSAEHSLAECGSAPRPNGSGMDSPPLHLDFRSGHTRRLSKFIRRKGKTKAEVFWRSAHLSNEDMRS